MRPWITSDKSPESGRASLEFLVFGVGVMIPVMFMGMSLWSIQEAQFAANSAATQAARVFVQENDLVEASRRAERAALVAAKNHGFSSYSGFQRKCAPPSCLSPGSIVSMWVAVDAPLFTSDLLPGVLGAETVMVSAESARVVSRYGVPR